MPKSTTGFLVNKIEDYSEEDIPSLAVIPFENNGGKVLGTISTKLDILVIGNSKPTKKKIEHAKQLNIKIIKESDWYKLSDF